MQVVKLPSDKNLKIQNPLSYFTFLPFPMKKNSDFLNKKATQSQPQLFTLWSLHWWNHTNHSLDYGS